MKNYKNNLNNMFSESNNLEKEIIDNFNKLKFNKNLKND